MVDQGKVTEKALATIKSYVNGFMEAADEVIDEASESSDDADGD